MQPTVFPIPIFNDNYIWCIQVEQNIIVVDPGIAEPVIQTCKANSLTCIGILVTHHHFDHIGGLNALHACWPTVPIYGPQHADIKVPLQELNTSFHLGGLTIDVTPTPGHTLDHVIYHINDMLFVGDTLFSGGCGRIFEGTPKQMLTSLNYIKSLPDETQIFCAHEYTHKNLKFAQYVEPSNQAIQAHLIHLAQQPISLPSTLKIEKCINPFLRLDSAEIKQQLAPFLKDAAPSELAVFTQLRILKDEF